MNRMISQLAAAWICIAVTMTAYSATLLVDSLADDVFPNHLGQLFDAAGNPVVLTSQKCTLRMATVASNIDARVGNLDNTSTTFYGCDAQVTTPATTFNSGGGDVINFAAATAGGTINLNSNKGMDIDGAGETFVMLWFTGPISLDGSAGSSSRITLDAAATPTTNRRIMRFQESSTNRFTAGTSAWAQVLSMNLRNARMEGAGGCVFSNESVRFTDVEFSNCESAVSGIAGALYVAASDNASTSFRPNVRLSRVTFKNNRAFNTGNTAQGGAFLLGANNARAGHVSFTDVTVGGAQVGDGNIATGQYGGGLIVNAESVSITNSRFENNMALSGNAGALLITGTLSSAVTIIDTTFTKNTANGQIGALWVQNNGTSSVLLRRVNVTQNTAQSIGGMRLNGNSGNVDLTGVNVTDNTATSSVGGAQFDSNSSVGTVRIVDSQFSGNSVSAGSVGGLLMQSQGGPTTLTRVKIQNNSISKGATNYAGNAGAGFFNNVNLTLQDSEISGNTSDFHIGAFGVSASFLPYDSNGNPVAILPPTNNRFTLERTTVSGNSTTAPSNQGFATIYVTTPGIYTFVSSTITGNSNTGCGGGLNFDGFNPSAQTNSMQVQIYNSTIARNTGQCSEALAVGAFNAANPSTPAVFNGSVTIDSSIFGGRAFPPPTSVFDAASGVSISASASLFESSNSPTVTASCGTSGIICNQDAKLGPLIQNGGATRTLGLLVGSPARDTGANAYATTIDQRMAARMQGSAPDMGAFEATPIVATACSLDMDGAGGVQATKEGLVLLRSMLGMSDVYAVLGTGITQPQWSAVKANLNANCGTAGSFAP
ncbi:MAG: hypothetical protein EAZ21_11905 [Betaproteobacteria bacterium]|nr:MAG: hypothetical protein EAZ21_11905 [Betaproteobacteria bacterium]